MIIYSYRSDGYIWTSKEISCNFAVTCRAHKIKFIKPPTETKQLQEQKER